MTTRSAPHLMLYSRPWCHLCEQMLDELKPLAEPYGATIEVVDPSTAA